MFRISPILARRLVRGYGFERYRMGRSKLKSLVQGSLPKKIEVELASGFWMELDLTVERQVYDFYHHEEDESALQWATETFCPISGTFVDVGANIGFFGLYAMWKRGAKTLFFEPHPRLAAQIERSLSLNRYGDRGKVIQMAVSDVRARQRSGLTAVTTVPIASQMVVRRGSPWARCAWPMRCGRTALTGSTFSRSTPSGTTTTSCSDWGIC